LEDRGVRKDPVGVEVVEFLELEDDPGLVVARDGEAEADVEPGHDLVEIVAVDPDRLPARQLGPRLDNAPVGSAAEIPQDGDLERHPGVGLGGGPHGFGGRIVERSKT
jgi:hypothetical protein